MAIRSGIVHWLGLGAIGVSALGPRRTAQYDLQGVLKHFRLSVFAIDQDGNPGF